MNRRAMLTIFIQLTLCVMAPHWHAIAEFITEPQHHQLIIVGSGPAGLTAAIYAGRAKLQPLVIEGDPCVLTTAPTIENWPGLEHTDGATLINALRTHARNVGAQLTSDRVEQLELGKAPFVVQCENGGTLTADALIIATGTTPKKANCAGEQELWGRGVNSCALCDAPLYNKRPVVVVGSGMMALQNILWLRKYASTITVVNSDDALHGPKKMLAEVMQIPHLIVINSSELRTITGTERVNGIVIANTKTGTQQTIACDGVFISLGYEPNTSLVTGKLPINQEGKIVIDPLGHTIIPGVFAAGSVASTPHSQAIICAASGSIAAIEAEKFLGHKPRKKSLWSWQNS